MVKTPAVPAGSNWQALKKKLNPTTTTGGNEAPLKRKRSQSINSTISEPKLIEQEDFEDNIGGKASTSSSRSRTEIPVEEILAGGGEIGWKVGPGQFLAIDCEMVGVGPEGIESTLARVSIVNYHGSIILDEFVRPREKVTDYRTWVSGVREEDLKNAPSFIEVQKKVADLIKGRVLIGHALTNDTAVLLLSHPRPMTRDTAKYSPLQGLARTKKPSLKTLAKLCLGVDIQSGEHSSVDDARVTMAIYRTQKTSWEDSLRTHVKPILVTNSTPTLSSIDLDSISLTGVKPSKNPKPKTLGLAATIRHARNEAELESKVELEMTEEAAEERTRKKVKKEELDGIILNFDYEKPMAVIPVVKVRKEVVKKVVEGGVKKKFVPKGVRSARGDEGKRPKSKESWWEE